MVWVIVFLAIALVGLGVVVSYAVWLAHKSADVLAEVAVLGQRGGQLLELLDEVRVPEFSTRDGALDSSRTVESTVGPVSGT